MTYVTLDPEFVDNQSPVIPLPSALLAGDEVVQHLSGFACERRGELLEEYLRWLVARIGQLRSDARYLPRLHFDTYGTVGLAFDGDIDSVARYLAGLGDVAAPHADFIAIFTV